MACINGYLFIIIVMRRKQAMYIYVYRNVAHNSNGKIIIILCTYAVRRRQTKQKNKTIQMEITTIQRDFSTKKKNMPRGTGKKYN